MKLNTIIYDASDAKNISGHNNTNLKVLEGIYNVSLDIHRESIITDTKDEEILSKLEQVFSLMIEMSKKNVHISTRDVTYLVEIVEHKLIREYMSLHNNRKAICHTNGNKPIYPKTIKQQEYMKALESKDMVFSIGAAGTGKTFLTVCHAVSLLKKGDIKKIILTRPAVEAGESLGFLPGDLKEKIDPYLRPLYDALHETLGVEQTNDLLERHVIEIAPLAYMRGRTLENAYVILDEAQNTTTMQMKMFLTRMGFNSKMVITGDVSQTDLPRGKESGLIEATRILKGINEIAIVKFERMDVVRHPLVGKILACYGES